jgi:hypothetical protein
MNIIFHRGYLGFQPADVTAEIPYSLTKPVIESFIADGILYLPVSYSYADQDDLGNSGNIMSSYKISRGIYSRWLQWDSRGPADNQFLKELDAPEGSCPTYSRISLSVVTLASAVLALRNDSSEDYLPALVHADATLDQIDSFCCDFYVGSGRPFVWNKYDDVKKLIIDSIKEKIIFRISEVREGPSRYLPNPISETSKDPVPTEIQKERLLFNKYYANRQE